MRTEQQALVLSSVAGLAAGLAGVAFAALSGSRAILLDGAYNLCFFVTALITLRIARLLQLPDDRRYPFGYLHFEPLINLVKGLLILGILVAFCLNLLLSRGGHGELARLVDPLVVASVVILTLAVPFAMTWRALSALLQRSPGDEIVDSIRELVQTCCDGLAVRELYVRVVRPGRTTYALVHVLLEPSATTMDVQAADELRRTIIERLATEHAPLIVDVLFTGIERYAAPTTGFTE